MRRSVLVLAASSLVLGAVAVFGLAGCGDKVTCGKGTNLRGGQCVTGAGPEVVQLIADEVATARKLLGELSAAFDAGGGNPRDPEAARTISEQLAKVPPLADRARAVFAASQALSPDDAALVVELYAELQLLDVLLGEHAKVAKTDDAAIAGRRAQAERLRSTDGLGIVLSNPEDGRVDPRIEVVELGGVMCGTKLAATGACDGDEAPSAFLYRGKDTGPWRKANLMLPGSLEPGAPFPLETILLPQHNEVLAGLVEGNTIAVGEVAYVARLARIHEHVEDAVLDSERLQDALAKDLASR